MPQVSAIKASFPYRNQLSYGFSPFKVFSALHAYMEKELPKAFNNMDEGCSIEMCPDLTAKDKVIDTYIVYGEQANKYYISSFPSPKRKPKAKDPKKEK